MKKWHLRWKEDEAKGSTEDQIKVLRSQVRDLRRAFWIVSVSFLLSATSYHIQYFRVRLGQQQVIAADQQLYEAVKENHVAFENLETAILRFIGTIHR